MEAFTEQTETFFSSVSSEQQTFFGTPITSESSSVWLSQPTQEIPHLDEPNVPGREPGCGSHVMCVSAQQYQPLHVFPLQPPWMLDLQFLYSSLTSLARDRGWEQGGGKASAAGVAAEESY